MHDYQRTIDHLLNLADWTDRLAPGLWAPPAAVQACLPWYRSYLRQLVDTARVDERVLRLPNSGIHRMMSIHDVLAVVERAHARQQAANRAERRQPPPTQP